MFTSSVPHTTCLMLYKEVTESQQDTTNSYIYTLNKILHDLHVKLKLLNCEVL